MLAPTENARKDVRHPAGLVARGLRLSPIGLHHRHHFIGRDSSCDAMNSGFMRLPLSLWVASENRTERGNRDPTVPFGNERARSAIPPGEILERPYSGRLLLLNEQSPVLYHPDHRNVGVR